MGSRLFANATSLLGGHDANNDVHRAKVFGRCESSTGIAPFKRLVDQVMRQPLDHVVVLGMHHHQRAVAAGDAVLVRTGQMHYLRQGEKPR